MIYLSSKTVMKALNVLEKFTVDRPTWGLRELARELDMSHTIVHRLLSTFETRGYLFQNPETQKYELGIKFMELSNVVEENLKLSQWIEPIMKQVAEETGESVVLTLLDNSEGLFAKIVESNRQVRFAESIGKRSPLYKGASHKVILAFLPEEVQLEIAQQGMLESAEEIVSSDLFLTKLAEIKRREWAYTSGETIQEVAAISVPLFDYQKQVLGSLSVAGPVYRIEQVNPEQVASILKRNCLELSSILSKVCFPTRRNYLLKQL
ncbi:IclR family transcriptional regulator [Amphibacillus sediminis]|uniref:IclR family transcriptional regulator n=1 Tax=Amphibacillus sediminis TaxID=360185 RepID=UPI000834A540|nr:IclR family transcriptional regulator [Amphibacillus sediminis]